MRRVVTIRETKTKGFAIRMRRELVHQPTLIDAVETVRIWDFPGIRFRSLNGKSGLYPTHAIGIAKVMAVQAGKEAA